MQVCVPVHPPGALLGLDVNVVMVHLQLRDFHLKEVGLELDCPAHGAKVWPRRGLEYILWNGGRWGIWRVDRVCVNEAVG